MKKFLSLVLFVILALAVSVTAFAAETVDSGFCGAEGDGSNLSWVFDTDGVLTISGTGAMENYTEQNTANGWKTTAPWNYYIEEITDIVIEDGVTSIGEFAFYVSRGADITEIVNIPKSVKTVGRTAFQGLGITVVFEGRPDYIGNYAFDYWDGYTVYFLDGAPLDQDWAFGNGANLFYVTGTEDKWTFDEDGFWNNYTVLPYTLAPEIEYNPARFTYSGYCGADPVVGEKNMAWGYNADSLELVLMGTGAMKDYAIDWEKYENYCNTPWIRYKEDIISVVVEDGVTEIGACAFFRLFSLEKIYLPDSLREIGRNAFREAGFIDGLEIPEGVEIIRNSAFLEFSAPWFYIPSTVKDTGDHLAFVVNKVEEIRVSENSKLYTAVDGVLLSKDEKTLIAFPGGRTGKYTVPESVETIGIDAFNGIMSNSITVGENVKRLYSGSFDQLVGNVVIEGQLEYIDYGAFKNQYGEILSVYFLGGAPLDCSEDIVGTWDNEGRVDFYYLVGTEDKWNFDENGLWNGYEVKPYTKAGEIEFDPDDFVDSGYCGNDPLGGKNLAWGYGKDGKLHIFGKGGMDDYTETYSDGRWISTAPWAEYITEVEDIVIEDGVTHIGSYAFYCNDDANIPEVVTIPESVETIGRSAFCGGISCTVVFEGRPEIIFNWAFDSWSNGFKIYFMAGAPLNAENAFSGATLYYLVGTEDLWEFDENGFWNNYRVYPYEVGEVVEFDPADFLYSGYCGADPIIEGKNIAWGIDKDGTLTVFGKGEMANYSEYYKGNGYWYYDIPWHEYHEQIYKIVIEDGITKIGNYAFYELYMVEEFPELPKSVESIGVMSFALSGYYGDLVIPEGVRKIDTAAFQSNRFTSVHIPASVVGIGQNAFSYNNVQKFTVSPENEWFSAVGGALFSKDGSELYMVPSGWVGEYKIPEGTKIISYSVFTDTYNINSVVIPESVDMIFDGAFWGYNGSVIVEGQLDYIDGWCFRAWQGDSIDIYFLGGEPLGIGDNAFYMRNDSVINLYYITGTEDKWNFDANGLWRGYEVKPYTPGKEAEFDPADFVASGYCGSDPLGGKNMAWGIDKNGVLKIFGSGRMKNYAELEVNNGDYYRTSAEWYDHIDKITSLEIGDEIENIGSYAFLGMYNLTGKLVVPGNVKEIGAHAFVGAGFDEIVLEEGVEVIRIAGFSQLFNAKKITVPSTVEQIELRAFWLCPEVEEFVISENNPYYKNIGCVIYSKDGSRLIQFISSEKDEFTVPETVTVIGDCAFFSAEIKKVTIPENVKILEDMSFCNVGIIYDKVDIVIKGQLNEIWGRVFTALGTETNVYFMGDAPLNVYENDIYNSGSFGEEFDGGELNIYYCEGTSGWELDENGLWKGYEIKLYEESEVMYGDIDGNGKINVLDSNMIRRYSARLMELDEKQLAAADVDGNGKINVMDSNLVRRFAARIIDKFPVEE